MLTLRRSPTDFRQIVMDISCLAAFRYPPALSLTWRARDKEFGIRIRLPLSPASFNTTYKLAAEQFGQRQGPAAGCVSLVQLGDAARGGVAHCGDVQVAESGLCAAHVRRRGDSWYAWCIARSLA